jgi:hypothetical protein
MRPQASEGEAQHGPFCGTERFKYTGVCVVDSMGFGSSKVASEPDAQLRAASGKWRLSDLPVRYDGHPWVPRDNTMTLAET